MRITFDVITEDSPNVWTLFSAQRMVQLTRLLRNINPKSVPVTDITLRQFFDHSGTIATAINSNGNIVGIATLILCHKIGWRTARVENVSVLKRYSGHNIGRGLTEMMIFRARGLGISQIDLICNPKRERANELYEKLGFRIEQTNTRRLIL